MNITTLIMVYFINLYFFLVWGGGGVRELQQNIEIQFTATHIQANVIERMWSDKCIIASK